MFKNKLIYTVILLILTTSISYGAEMIDKIVAVVNDDIITLSELEESMQPFIADYKIRYGEEELEYRLDEARKDALNRLVEEKLIIQEAKIRDVKVEDAEIEVRVDRVKKRFKTEEEFYYAIKQSGVTLPRLREKYKEQIMMRKLISSLINARVAVSPTQIAAHYYGNIADFTVPESIRFKVLLVKILDTRPKEETRAIAVEALDTIRAGGDFDMVVTKYSEGPNIEQGGDMGYMPKGGILKELDNALFELNINETSELIETEVAFYIVKVVDKKEAGTRTLVEATDLIKERLFQRESELTLREFVDKLKEDAYIKIN